MSAPDRAAASPDPTDRRAAALARLVAGYDGYRDPKRRRDTERALRQAVARQLRQAQGPITAAQRQLRAAGRFDALPPLEALFGRLDRLIDRLLAGSAGYADWLGDRRLPDAARAALVALDHALWSRALDFEVAARALDATDPALAASVGCLQQLADALFAAFDARAAALVAPSPPSPVAPRSPLDERMIGDTLRVVGEARTVVGRAEWDRGDQALVLGDRAPLAGDQAAQAGGPAVSLGGPLVSPGGQTVSPGGPPGELRLWQDLAGRLVLFEAQPIAITLPPPGEVPLEGERFRLAWADEGRALVRDTAGGRRVATPRWLYTGDAGGWLWVEAEAGGARTWLGLPVDATEVTVI